MIDFMVMEAVHVKALAEDAEAREKAEKEQKKDKFKQDFSMLEQFR